MDDDREIVFSVVEEHTDSSASSSYQDHKPKSLRSQQMTNNMVDINLAGDAEEKQRKQEINKDEEAFTVTEINQMTNPFTPVSSEVPWEKEQEQKQQLTKNKIDTDQVKLKAVKSQPNVQKEEDMGDRSKSVGATNSGSVKREVPERKSSAWFSSKMKKKKKNNNKSKETIPAHVTHLQEAAPVVPVESIVDYPEMTLAEVLDKSEDRETVRPILVHAGIDHDQMDVQGSNANQGTEADLAPIHTHHQNTTNTQNVSTAHPLLQRDETADLQTIVESISNIIDEKELLTNTNTGHVIEWKHDDDKVDDHYGTLFHKRKEVVRVVLDASVQIVFNCLFLDPVVNFATIHVREMGCSDATVTSWTKEVNQQKSGHASGFWRSRTFKYVKPLKYKIGPKETSVIEKQHISFTSDGGVVVEVEGNNLDVPYGNSFRVETTWELKPLTNLNGQEQCLLLSSVATNFLKSTMLQSTILSGIKKECTQSYTLFCELAREEVAKYRAAVPDIQSPQISAPVIPVPAPAPVVEEPVAVAGVVHTTTQGATKEEPTEPKAQKPRRKSPRCAHPGSEWIYKVLASFWPYYQEQFGEQFTKAIEPVIRSSLPSNLRSFQFSKAELGSVPPFIYNLQPYRKETASKKEDVTAGSENISEEQIDPSLEQQVKDQINSDKDKSQTQILECTIDRNTNDKKKMKENEGRKVEDVKPSDESKVSSAPTDPILSDGFKIPQAPKEAPALSQEPAAPTSLYRSVYNDIESSEEALTDESRWKLKRFYDITTLSKTEMVANASNKESDLPLETSEKSPVREAVANASNQTSDLPPETSEKSPVIEIETVIQSRSPDISNGTGKFPNKPVNELTFLADLYFKTKQSTIMFEFRLDESQRNDAPASSSLSSKTCVLHAGIQKIKIIGKIIITLKGLCSTAPFVQGINVSFCEMPSVKLGFTYESRSRKTDSKEPISSKLFQDKMRSCGYGDGGHRKVEGLMGKVVNDHINKLAVYPQEIKIPIITAAEQSTPRQQPNVYDDVISSEEIQHRVAGSTTFDTVDTGISEHDDIPQCLPSTFFNFFRAKTDTICGVCKIVIREATNIPKRKNLKGMVKEYRNPYVKIYVGEDLYETQAVRKAKNPTWEKEMLDFSFEAISLPLRFELWDKKSLEADTLLGYRKLTVKHLIANNSRDMWIDLKSTYKEIPRVHVQCLFFKFFRKLPPSVAPSRYLKKNVMMTIVIRRAKRLPTTISGTKEPIAPYVEATFTDQQEQKSFKSYVVENKVEGNGQNDIMMAISKRNICNPVWEQAFHHYITLSYPKTINFKICSGNKVIGSAEFQMPQADPHVSFDEERELKLHLINAESHRDAYLRVSVGLTFGYPSNFQSLLKPQPEETEVQEEIESESEIDSEEDREMRSGDDESGDTIERNQTLESQKSFVSENLIDVVSNEQDVWLGDLLQVLWPQLNSYLKRSTQRLVENALQEKLESLFPCMVLFVHFKEYDLGTKAAKLHNLSTHQDSDRLELRANLQLESNCRFMLSLDEREYLNFGVNDISIQGRVSIVFHSLKFEVPSYSDLRISFLDLPCVEMKFSKLASIGNLRFLQQHISEYVENVMALSVVSPNYISISSSRQEIVFGCDITLEESITDDVVMTTISDEVAEGDEMYKSGIISIKSSTVDDLGSESWKKGPIKALISSFRELDESSENVFGRIRDMKVEKYLTTMKHFLVVFDAFSGTPAGDLSKHEIQKNMKKVSKASRLLNVTTLYQLLSTEKKKKKNGVNSGTEGLLWMNRILEFVYQIFMTFEQVEPNAKMSKIVSTAYENSLKTHHNWMLKKLFKQMLGHVPSRKSFFEALGGDEASLAKDTKEFCVAYKRIIDNVNDYFRDLTIETKSI